MRASPIQLRAADGALPLMVRLRVHAPGNAAPASTLLTTGARFSPWRHQRFPCASGMRAVRLPPQAITCIRIAEACGVGGQYSSKYSTRVLHSIHATMTVTAIAIYPIGLNRASHAWMDYPPIPAKLLPLIILAANEDIKASLVKYKSYLNLLFLSERSTLFCTFFQWRWFLRF